MKNQDLDYFKKGDFQPIDDEFIADGLGAMCKVASVQRKYNLTDTDTVLNELHDAIVGKHLGFKLVNKEKHGFDCKLSSDENIFLESKVASLHSKTITATFNDTTTDKAEVFKDEKTWLALSVWSTASELVFIAFGQHEDIGNYLEKRSKAVENTRTRSTQSIALSKLITDYEFDIIAVSITKQELFTFLTTLNSNLRKHLSIDDIYELKDYELPHAAKIDAEETEE